jgi:hypothetical protein
VQLVERDDDFGDGWYLGKHLMNGNTGLFPEGNDTHLPFAVPFINAMNQYIPNRLLAVLPRCHRPTNLSQGRNRLQLL